jgi:carbamoyltransferase
VAKEMKVLGLYDSHNCGAALVENGKIIAAIEEERLTRNKIEFGFPILSIKEVLRITRTNWEDLDGIAIVGRRDPTPFLRLNPSLFRFARKFSFKWNVQYSIWKYFYSIKNIKPIPDIEYFLNQKIIRRKILNIGKFPEKKIFFVDHHRCHAASAYRTSGIDKALIFAVDGSGDGYSTTVFLGDNGIMQFLGGSSERASLGKLYSNVTLGLGFSKVSGEGKVMGLAAYGDPEKFYDKVDDVVKIKNIDKLNFTSNVDLIGCKYAKQISKLCKQYQKKDIAAAVQKKLEEIMVKVVQHFVAKTGVSNVLLAGGVAMNVKMNQRIRELPEVDKFFVFPNMTDGGTPAGAALEVEYALSRQHEKYNQKRLKDVYFGPEYSNNQIEKELERNKIKAEFVKDIDKKIADLVIDGNIVGRFNGRMEYGPRALGNRTMISRCEDPKVEEVLNLRCNRDEFMPFAPSMQEEKALNEYLLRGVPAPYMVETFDVAEGLGKRFPAIVHIDNTCRPQTVDKETNPGYREIIDRVGKETGNYAILNTSFNMHGEPIVCSPRDALNTFKQGPVDYLAMGNWLVSFDQKLRRGSWK